VINLLVAYVNEIMVLCNGELLGMAYDELGKLKVTSQAGTKAEKKLRFKLNGPQANKVLKAFCKDDSPLMKLLAVSTPVTSNFQSAAERSNPGLCRDELQRLWVNHRKQVFDKYLASWLRLASLMTFLEDSGIHRDLSNDEIERFQKAARSWGDLWVSICPDRMPLYVHVLVCHVKYYLLEYGQIGLFSQQPSESKYKKLKEDFANKTNHHQDWTVQILKREWVGFF